MSIKNTYIAPLKAYDQTWDYYQRVIGDNGTLIDAEAVNRIYHSLNLLNLENRSYKLYHASAGLQKTSDQIDKLYDLGKDDIDQTFSGSDRPEHIQAWSNSEGVGNWQINVEKEATNFCKESNDLGAIVGGNWTKTEGAGDSPFGDSNEAVEVEMNTASTGASNYIELDVDTATNFSSGDYITVSFYAKKIAVSSGQPELLIEGEDSNSNPISLIQEPFSTQIGEYQFFEFTAQWSADGTLRQAGCRIQDNDTSADTVYQFWGMQIERGQYATSRIYTNGAIATRLESLPTMYNIFPKGGTIAFWGDFIGQSDLPNERLIARSVSYQIRFRHGTDPYYLQVFLDFKFTALRPAFTANEYERKRVLVVLSFSSTEQKLYIVDNSGEAAKAETANNVNTNFQDTSSGIGNAKSLGTTHQSRFEAILSEEGSLISDEKFKQLAKYVFPNAQITIT